MTTNIAYLPSAFAQSHVATRGSRGATKESPDTALVAAIAAGDHAAMRVLFARHQVRIYRFILRFVRDEAGAEDLVNEVFMDVWRKADKFEGRSEVSTWLLAIARNKAIESLRRRPTEKLNDDAQGAIEDTADNPETTLRKKQRSDLMRSCLTLLSPVHREVIDLVYYHERSIEDVAEILGVAQNTIKTRMFYARKHLAEILGAKGIVTAAA
jgi:RNA polymerase sigma-70 factor (ECF subfamily)